MSERQLNKLKCEVNDILWKYFKGKKYSRKGYIADSYVDEIEMCSTRLDVLYAICSFPGPVIDFIKKHIKSIDREEWHVCYN